MLIKGNKSKPSSKQPYDVAVGEVFRFRGDLYMKITTDDTIDFYVDLSSGRVASPDRFATVECVQCLPNASIDPGDGD